MHELQFVRKFILQLGNYFHRDALHTCGASKVKEFFF